MNILEEKFKEVLSSILPIVILVIILSFTLIDIPKDLMTRFIIGALLVLIGLSVFLLGVDLSIRAIGSYLSEEVATSRYIFKIVILSFLMGFLITVADPDLLILGEQVQKSSGGSLTKDIMVYVVSAGVGIMVTLGVFRILKNHKLNIFMAIIYGIIFILAIFVSEEFLAISFDSSGATTGALTTPFILALCAGIARIKGGISSEDDSFGLVGIMSSGPILSLMLLSIITGQKHIQGLPEEFILSEGILNGFITLFPSTVIESFSALFPIAILFMIYNFTKFKLEKKELNRIIKGLIYTILGLAIFLTGVNGGFMEMGRVMGMELSSNHLKLLPFIGLLMGLIVVLAEPAVNILGHQIQEVTSGHIPPRLIRLTLSIGVGIAIMLSMIKIMVPDIKLWYFLAPGFIIAIILSYLSEPIFVGIAYDAGGVASGPMTATFILAFAQGAADIIPTADVMVDGFGIIAMVAMAPVLSLMMLGTIFKRKSEKLKQNKSTIKEQIMENEENIKNPVWDFMMVEVDRGLANEVINLSREHGAKGATVVHGLSAETTQTFLGFSIMPEKEVVLMIVETHLSENIRNNLINKMGLKESNFILLPTEAKGLVNIK